MHYNEDWQTRFTGENPALIIEEKDKINLALPFLLNSTRPSDVSTVQKPVSLTNHQNTNKKTSNFPCRALRNKANAF